LGASAIRTLNSTGSYKVRESKRFAQLTDRVDGAGI